MMSNGSLFQKKKGTIRMGDEIQLTIRLSKKLDDVMKELSQLI